MNKIKYVNVRLWKYIEYNWPIYYKAVFFVLHFKDTDTLNEHIKSIQKRLWKLSLDLIY